MSLEAALLENTKAQSNVADMLAKLIDATDRLAGLRADAIETVKTTAAPKAETKPKTIQESAKELAGPAAAAITEEEKAAKLRSAAEAHPVGKLILQYVGTGYDEAHAQAKDERAARTEKVKALYAKLGEIAKKDVTTYSDIPAGQLTDAAVGKLNEWIAAGNLVIKADADLGGL